MKTQIRFSAIALLSLSLTSISLAQQAATSVKVTKMDTPASIVAGTGAFDLNRGGIKEQEQGLKPKDGYTFLRLRVRVVAPSPGIVLKMNSFELRPPPPVKPPFRQTLAHTLKEPIYPVGFFTCLMTVSMGVSIRLSGPRTDRLRTQNLGLSS